ncbi:MAG: HsdM family class I SAM-dependent methyltransferase [Planctomycetota bacterium]|jgi:type I restriction-modification system DNA methylase subunit
MPLCLWHAFPSKENSRKALRDARRKLGLFFTPEPIVDRICRLAVPKPAKGRNAPTVCDPAMGAGHFLIAMAWHMGQGNQQSARHIAATRLYGCDIDGEAVRLTRISLWLEFSTPLLPFEVPNHFVHGDSLIGGLWGMDEIEEDNRLQSGIAGMDWYDVFPEMAKQGGFDVIVGNPPYDVLTGFGKQPELKTMVTYLRGCGLYEASLGGQLNLYRLFIERALCLLKKSGALSFIIPASFLTDKVAGPLRRTLLRQHGLKEIDHFSESEKGIEGVGQSLIIFLAHKGAGQEQ